MVLLDPLAAPSCRHPAAPAASLCFCHLACCLLQAVGELLEVLGADGSLLVQVPAWHYADPQLPAGATSLPLRDALERCYDLRQPKPELLQLLHGRLAAALAAAEGAGVAADGGQLQQEPMLLPAVGKLRGKQQHVRGKDSASELSAGLAGAAMAQGLHGRLCGQGCVVDRLEVGGKWRGGESWAGSVWEGSKWAAAMGAATQVASQSLAALWRWGVPTEPADTKLAWRTCLPLPPPVLQQLAALVADPAGGEAYLAPRHVIDVLRDFLPTPTDAPQLLLGPAQLLGTLRQLQPRLYSISSSQVGAAGLGWPAWSGLVWLPAAWACRLGTGLKEADGHILCRHSTLLTVRASVRNPVCSWSTRGGCRPLWQWCATPAWQPTASASAPPS